MPARWARLWLLGGDSRLDGELLLSQRLRLDRRERDARGQLDLAGRRLHDAPHPRPVVVRADHLDRDGLAVDVVVAAGTDADLVLVDGTLDLDPVVGALQALVATGEDVVGMVGPAGAAGVAAARADLVLGAGHAPDLRPVPGRDRHIS